MATIALFIALGGTSYAVQQINGKTIKNRTIAAKKIKRNSLGGTEISESKLARVPSAAKADTAASATHATSATDATYATNAADADTLNGLPATSLELSCSPNTIAYAGVCFESTSRPAQSYPGASKTCGDANGRLPTVSELQGFRQLNGVTLTAPGEMQSDMFSDVQQFGGEIGYFRVDDGGSVNTVAGSSTTAFRCVFERTN